MSEMQTAEGKIQQGIMNPKTARLRSFCRIPVRSVAICNIRSLGIPIECFMHPLAGVMAQNKRSDAEKKQVWSVGDQLIKNKYIESPGRRIGGIPTARAFL